MGDCADFIKSLQTTTAQANDEEQLSLVATETKAHSAAKGGRDGEEGKNEEEGSDVEEGRHRERENGPKCC